MHRTVVHSIKITQLRLPLRADSVDPYDTASPPAAAGHSEPVFVAVELQGGCVGFGEALPQPDRPGEDHDAVLDAIQYTLGPALLDFGADSFPLAAEQIEHLPWHDERGQAIVAARTAVELALLDACLKHFGRSLDDLVAWMGLPGFGKPGSRGSLRYTAELPAGSLAQLRRRLRWQRWGGYRDFRLPVGQPGDAARLAEVRRQVGSALDRGTARLHLDAQGRWSKDDAIAWLSDHRDLPLASVEQPLAPQHVEDGLVLHDLFDVPIVQDESVVTLEEAEHLVEHRLAAGLHLRIGKCGGLLPTLRLVALARRHHRHVVLSHSRGETSLLAGATLRLVELCPQTWRLEGGAACQALLVDPARRRLRPGWAGRLPGLDPSTWGVDVDIGRVEALSTGPPVVMKL